MYIYRYNNFPVCRNETYRDKFTYKYVPSRSWVWLNWLRSRAQLEERRKFKIALPLTQIKGREYINLPGALVELALYGSGYINIAPFYTDSSIQLWPTEKMSCVPMGRPNPDMVNGHNSEEKTYFLIGTRVKMHGHKMERLHWSYSPQNVLMPSSQNIHFLSPFTR